MKMPKDKLIRIWIKKYLKNTMEDWRIDFMLESYDKYVKKLEARK